MSKWILAIAIAVELFSNLSFGDCRDLIVGHSGYVSLTLKPKSVTKLSREQKLGLFMSLAAFPIADVAITVRVSDDKLETKIGFIKRVYGLSQAPLEPNTRAEILRTAPVIMVSVGNNREEIFRLDQITEISLSPTGDNVSLALLTKLRDEALLDEVEMLSPRRIRED